MRAISLFSALAALSLEACFIVDVNDFIISCEDDGDCPDGQLCANELICADQALLLPAVDPVVTQTPFGFALVTGKSLGGADLRILVDGDEVVDGVVDPDPDPLQAIGDFSFFVPLGNGNNQITVEAELDNVIEVSEIDINGDDLEVNFNANTALFVDVAAARGVGFAVPFRGVLDDGNDNQNNQSATFQDIDNDGDVDLIIGSDPNDVVRLNNGDGDFNAGPAFFSRVATVFADVDQDGDLDAALASSPNGQGQDVAALFENQLIDDGDLAFEAPTFFNDARNSEGVVFFEGANEGFVDLFLQDGGENRVEKNNGNGVFNNEDQQTAPSGGGNGSFAAACDFNQNGRIDLIVNDLSGSQFFLGNGNGAFTKIDGNFLVADGDNRQRGLVCADVDQDGVFDLLIARGGNGLNFVKLQAQGNNVIPQNVANLQVASDGVSVGDIDLDGDLDIIAAEAGADRLLLNQGGVQGGVAGTFIDASNFLLQAGGNAEGTAVADIDGDGDLEIFVSDQNVASRLYDNRFNDVHSKKLRVVRTGENGVDVDVIGAVVALFENKADDPAFFGVRQVDGGSGGSQEPLTLHFGGAAPNRTYLALIRIPGCNDDIEVNLGPQDTIFRFVECP